MKKDVIKKTGVFFLMILIVFHLSGCSSDNQEVQSIGQQFVQQLFSGQFQEATKFTTGEQLSILRGQAWTLEQLNYQGKVDRLEIIDNQVDGEQATVDVHMERTVKVDQYQQPDARSIRLFLTKINEKWYVYRMIELNTYDLK